MPHWTLHPHDDIASLQAPWEEIQTHNGHDRVLCDFELVRHWYSCFNDADTPVFLSLWEGGACVAIYPMLLERKAGARVLKNLWIDTFSIAFPLVRRELRPGFYEHFLAALRRSDLEWDILKLSAMPTYAFEEYGLSRDAFTRAGHANLIIDDPTYCVDLQEPFREYFDRYFSSHARRNYNNKRNKLKRRNARFLHFTGQEALDHWEVFLDIENDGWKKAQGSSIEQAKQYKRYCDLLVRKLRDYDRLHINLLEADGKPIAGTFNYLEAGVFNGMKTGYLPEYKNCSPSQLLLLHMIRELQEHAPEALLFNSYPHAYGYKETYAHDRESFLTFLVANRTARARVFLSLYRLKNRGAKRKRTRRPASDG